jgi:hypothetical protein
LPTDELFPFLREWCEKNRWLAAPDEDWRNTEACTPVAAMLLAKAPPPGLAAKVLRESHEELSFWVLDGKQDLSKMKREENESRGCPVTEDQSRESPPSEVRKRFDREVSRWPPLFTYLLQNAASPYPGTLLVDAGGEAVTYRRVTALTVPTECYPPPNAFYEDFKHHLLAEMLETNDESIPWPLRREAVFFLHDPAEFLPALKKQIEHEEAAFRETVEALEKRGHLTRNEAATIRPRLQVTVYDARTGVPGGHNRMPPLPNFDSKDPLISVGFDTTQSSP